MLPLPMKLFPCGEFNSDEFFEVPPAVLKTMLSRLMTVGPAGPALPMLLLLPWPESNYWAPSSKVWCSWYLSSISWISWMFCLFNCLSLVYLSRVALPYWWLRLNLPSWDSCCCESSMFSWSMEFWALISWFWRCFWLRPD